MTAFYFPAYMKPDKPFTRRNGAGERPFEAITATPLTPHIGAEIGNIDLTKSLLPAQVEELRAAFARYQVIFFRDQKISNDDQSRLASYFGPLGQHVASISGSTQTADPNVRKFEADEHSQVVSGADFHTDQSHKEFPPLASVLYLHTIPPDGGGDTMFASMYAAYDALSPHMQGYLEPLTAVHDGTRVFGPEQQISVHPVIFRHPVSGKKAIYVNGSFTAYINDIPRLESTRILAFLHEHCVNDTWTCRFRWRPHSIAMWDNRCVQHKAIWDYYPHKRSGFRVQVEGGPDTSVPGWPAPPLHG